MFSKILWGIEAYEKNVINQYIEFINYFITDTIRETKVFRDFANKNKIDVAEMRIAMSID